MNRDIQIVTMMRIYKIVISFAFTLFTCVVIMTLVNLIPTEAIRENSKSSAAYLMESELFHYTIDDYVNSQQDNYADANWMSIVYAIDSDKPFISAIRAEYAQQPFRNINEGFYRQVYEGEKPKESYSRYWHGAMIYIRPLLIFTDLSGIRMIMGALITVLSILICAALWRMGSRMLSVCFGLSLLSIHPWMLYQCLEYATPYLVMSAAILAVLSLIKNDRLALLPACFVAVGTVTCFMDFLTVETVTFTVPMLLLFFYLMETGDRKSWQLIAGGEGIVDGALYIVKNGAAWFFGYAGAFLVKLILVYFVCGKAELIKALSVAAERATGDVYLRNNMSLPTLSAGQRFSGAIWRNIAALFPVHEYNMSQANTILMAGTVLVVSAVIIYLFRRDVKASQLVIPLLLAGLPYVRYLVLSNHSYSHYFFTYRAQLVTVLALFYMTFSYGIKNIPTMVHGKGR